MSGNKRYECRDLCPICKHGCVLEYGHIVPEEEAPAAHHCERHWWIRVKVAEGFVTVTGEYSKEIKLKRGTQK